MPGDCDPLDKVIEDRLAVLATCEIAGAYRALCGMMLVQTVVACRKRAITRKDDACAKRLARSWIANKRQGIIPFGEVCEVLNLDLERTRSALNSAAG